MKTSQAQRDEFKAYYQANKEALKKAASIRYREKREEILRMNAEWRKNNPDRVRFLMARWIKNNRDKYRAYKKRWDAANKSKRYSLKEYHAKYKSDIQYRLRRRLRKAIERIAGFGIKTKKHALEYLGCTIAEARKHVECQWSTGMDWNNYGPTGWHIDHKRPLASFDLTIESNLELALHFSNLQPLWAIDNLKKGKTIS